MYTLKRYKVGEPMVADHYYSANPKSELITKQWQFPLREHLFTFNSSKGVFSKDRVDFGSQLLIETFVEPEVDGELLDLGCGYGPIGIALAYHFPNRHVTLVDVNERAVLLAQKNAMENNTKNVTIMQSNGFERVEGQQFVAIVMNPPIRAGKKLVHTLYKESKQHLVSGGELWIVIQKKQGAPSTIHYLSTMFTTVEVVHRKKGYHIVRAINN